MATPETEILHVPGPRRRTTLEAEVSYPDKIVCHESITILSKTAAERVSAALEKDDGPDEELLALLRDR